MSCPKCLDPQGVPCFPAHGLAPHTHTPIGLQLQIPEVVGFTPDPDRPQMGTYWCTFCDEGKPPS